MRMPRPIADVFCLWRDLLQAPREVLLVRGHHQWTGPVLVAQVALLDMAGRPLPGAVAAALLMWGGGSFLLDCLGTLAHCGWDRGRLWADRECQLCGDDGGPGDDGSDDPQVPDDPYALSAADEQWLNTISNLPTRERNDVR
ncbi:hypothetical protein [Streptomyces sp. NPDC007063]|uniref:hypothetical protein n=1 Tax=Streptomyces sp. NPDC007063 TaxID=3364772 RepID=UPI00369CF9AC